MSFIRAVWRREQFLLRCGGRRGRWLLRAPPAAVQAHVRIGLVEVDVAPVPIAVVAAAHPAEVVLALAVGETVILLHPLSVQQAFQ